MNKRMINSIIEIEIEKILKFLYKNDFFSFNNVSNMDEYLNVNFRSYDEIVTESYKNYIRNKILDEIDVFNKGEE